MASRSRSLPRLIGVIHLPALAGAPGSRGLTPVEALQRAGLQAVNEAEAFAQAGFDGIILENFGDIPFYKDRVPAETIASLAVIAGAVREVVPVAVGINVLRNDAFAALAIAAVTGCDFIRVNVLSGVVAADQGWIEGDAAGLIRERARLGADDVAILADVLVKHARTFSGDEPELAAEEAVLRAGAQGIVVSGATTGRPVDQERLMRVADCARKMGVPVYVGSGASLEALPGLKALGAGVIVSSALRKGGHAGAPLDSARLREFARAFRMARGGALGKPGKSKPSKPSAKSKKAGKKKGKRK